MVLRTALMLLNPVLPLQVGLRRCLSSVSVKLCPLTPGGGLRSYAPRLNVACRAAMFYPIFVLTAQQKITKYSGRMFLEQFFVTLFAYAFATICGVLCLEHSSAPALGAHVLLSIKTACELLPLSLDTILAAGFQPTPETPSPTDQPPTAGVVEKGVDESLQPKRTLQQDLSRRLREEAASMRRAYTAYSLDIVHARQNPVALKPVIKIFDRLQRNALLGPTGHVPGERIRAALERAYATPLSPATSRSVSRHDTPRRRQTSGRPDMRTPSMASFSSAESPVNAHRLSHDFRYPSHPALDQSPRRSTEVSAVQLSKKLTQVATHAYRHGERHSSNPSHARAERARASLKEACTSLSTAIVASFECSAAYLTRAYDWQYAEGFATPVTRSGTSELRNRLDTTLNDLQQRLSGIVDQDELHRSSSATTTTGRGVTFEDEVSTADWLDDEDRFRIAFYMIALIDLARETRGMLDVSVRLGEAERPKRWILPRINRPWSPWPSDVQLPSIDREVPTSTEHDDKDQRKIEDLDYVHALLRESREAPELSDMKRARTMAQRAKIAWRSIWDRRAVVASRVFLSTMFHALKHSRHVHFAVKQTLGISLLSLPAFMPAHNGGRKWYDSSLGAWMVVSFMYVLEVTSGATLRVGFYRMLGTFIGAVLGYIVSCAWQTNSSALLSPMSTHTASLLWRQHAQCRFHTASCLQRCSPWLLSLASRSRLSCSSSTSTKRKANPSSKLPGHGLS